MICVSTAEKIKTADNANTPTIAAAYQGQLSHADL